MPEAEDWIAKWEWERNKCPHHQGSFDECSDAEADWFPQRSICYPTMQRAAAERQWQSLHSEKPYHDGSFERWAKESSSRYPFHRDDGVTIWISKHDLSPDDDFLKQSDWLADLVAEQAPDQET